MVDPDPRVAGRGLAVLRAQGVEVLLASERSAEAAACRQLNAPFVHRVLHPRHHPLAVVLCTAAAAAEGDQHPLCGLLADAGRMAGGYALLQSAMRGVDAVLVSGQQLLALLAATDAAGDRCFNELFPPHITVVVAADAGADADADEDPRAFAAAAAVDKQLSEDQVSLYDTSYSATSI